ncbi:VirB3 family type IV secretion system protein [Variovorax sp. J22P271]|uniref:VirB3 family type IV secretion system protein n=1 Tax=Variovorax davisae TaxID=3053515 RepID=UPI00257861D4|nr:VirB3 family type IV secretion system protein [Variovorax sp. J22P271]MDM0036743.1 VirB3 family type IV secretion system protein [Variovorax sp. J22P271]
MRDRIFKGATRPAMMLGVPIVPCILVIGAFIVLAMWALVFSGAVTGLSVLVVLVFVIAVMRYMSSQDDHRLNQYLMYLRSRPFRRNAHFWRAHSMSPTNYKKRGGP